MIAGLTESPITDKGSISWYYTVITLDFKCIQLNQVKFSKKAPGND